MLVKRTLGTSTLFPLGFIFLVMALLCGEALGQSKAEDAPWVTVWAGALPIILAAPHGGRRAILGVPVRRGIGVPRFRTSRDKNTDELAEKVARKLEQSLGARPFLIIARFERRFVDANRASENAYEAEAARPYYKIYHRALEHACAQIRQRWGRGLLLDIHGQAAEAETIFRGTDNGKSVAALEGRFGRSALVGAKSIFAQLERRGYKIAPATTSTEAEQRYTGGYTTRTYGSHRGTGVDAIQLEIGARLRAQSNLERTAADLAESVKVFAVEYLPLGVLPDAAAAASPP